MRFPLARQPPPFCGSLKMLEQPASRFPKILSNVVTLDGAHKLPRPAKPFRVLLLRHWDCLKIVTDAESGDLQSVILANGIEQYLQNIAANKCPQCVTCKHDLIVEDDCHGFFVTLPGMETPTQIALMSGICAECAKLDNETLEKKFVVAIRDILPDARVISAANITNDGGRA
jgi:hypothetical protein